MARIPTSLRTFAALILLGALAAVFVSLGNWQLNRAAQRQATAQAIQSGRAAPPLRLDAATAATEFIAWRPAIADGTWMNALTVLLQNRNLNGRAGYWVATPLLIEPATNTAILVLRGWLARPVGPGQALPSVRAPDGAQTIEGNLLERVPRLFELWSSAGNNPAGLPAALPAPGQAMPQVQNLDLNEYARATGLKLLPMVLEQTSGGHDSLERQWQGPPVDADTNRGYALQWFSFAGIAAVAWLVIAWRAMRRRTGRRRP